MRFGVTGGGDHLARRRRPWRAGHARYAHKGGPSGYGGSLPTSPPRECAVIVVCLCVCACDRLAGSGGGRTYAGPQGVYEVFQIGLHVLTSQGFEELQHLRWIELLRPLSTGEYLVPPSVVAGEGRKKKQEEARTAVKLPDHPPKRLVCGGLRVP
jgi:hypothetical protein